MSRSKVNFIVDVVALAAFVLLAATGGLVKYVLPPGSGHFSTLWGMDRHEWGDLHFWIAVALTATMALHLFLHWQWIVGMVKGISQKGSGIRVAWAIAGLAFLAGIAAAPFLSRVEEKGELPPHKIQSGEHPASPAMQINGSMTLREIEQSTGVSAAVILRELGLPADLPTDERLGRLRKQHDFEIHAIRDIVEKQRARH